MNQETAQPRQKILFLITKATWGGAQRYVWDLATNMPRERFDVTVAYGEEGKLSLDLAAAHIRTVQIPSLARDVAILSDIQSFFAIWRYIEASAPDIVHLNSSKAAGLGALAARLLNTKRILFTAHGWPHKEPRSRLTRSLIYAVSWITALLSDDVIVVSREDETIARAMPGIAQKVRFVPLGRAPIPFLDPDAGFRAMFGALPVPKLNADTLRVTSIAELTRNKGLRYAIEAIRILAERGRDVIYVNAGDGEERQALSALARERGVADRVFLTPFVPEAARNLRGFDLFVLPSLKEGLPYVMIEAIMAGIPVIASSVVERDFASFQNVSFVSPEDPYALADAIEAAGKKARGDLPHDPFPLTQMLGKTMALYARAR